MADFDPVINSVIFKQFRNNGSKNYYEVNEVSGSNLLIHTDTTGTITGSKFLTPSSSNDYKVLIYEDGKIKSTDGPVGSVLYTNVTPTTQTLGGVIAGTTFNNVPISTIFDSLFYPYQSPAFTSFSISGQSTTLEVGQTIASGTHTFTWGTSNSGNVKSDSLTIRDTTNNLTLKSGMSNDGSEDIVLPVNVTKSSASSNIWTISGQNTNLVTFNRNFTVSWLWRMYLGESELTYLDESGVKSLRSSFLTSNSPGTYSFAEGDYKYKYIAYPDSLTTLTVFKDMETYLDVVMAGPPSTVSITNSYGIITPYYVHRTKNALGGALTIRCS